MFSQFEECKNKEQEKEKRREKRKGKSFDEGQIGFEVSKIQYFFCYLLIFLIFVSRNNSNKKNTFRAHGADEVLCMYYIHLQSCTCILLAKSPFMWICYTFSRYHISLTNTHILRHGSHFLSIEKRVNLCRQVKNVSLAQTTVKLPTLKVGG